MGSLGVLMGIVACSGNVPDPTQDAGPGADLGAMFDAGPGPVDMGAGDSGPIGTPNRNILVDIVIDGDTLIVSASSAVVTPDRQPLDGETVRLLGVDTPEIEHPPEPADCYGDEAKEFTDSKVGGRLVTLQYDTQNGFRDTFGRLLAYVEIRGEILNEELIKTGHARAFRQFPHRERSRYIALESDARDQNLGLWTCP